MGAAAATLQVERRVDDTASSYPWTVEPPLPNVSYFLSMANASEVWVHQVVDRRTNPPAVGLVRILVGPQASSWREDEVWTYRDYTFTARRVPLNDVRNWFEECNSVAWGTLMGQPGELQIRPESDQNFVRAPSRAPHDALHYPLPTLKISVALDVNDVVRQTPSDYFVGDGSTSFSTAAAAFNAFLHNDFTGTGMSPPQMGVMDVIIADIRGAFDRVVVRPSSVEVDISGVGTDLHLEMSSPTDREDVPLPADRHVEMPLSGGLPKECWLWLKNGSEWVDYRSLGSTSSGVVYDIPEDPVAGLSALISQGEDDQLEFKSQLPDAGNKDSKRKTFKTVAAFAQDSGGFIIFGLEDGSGAILGITEDEETAKQRFIGMVNATVRPTPKFRLSYQELDGRNLLVAEIQASGQIHSVVLDADRPEYFVRRGSTTFYARAEDLERVFAARQTISKPPWP